LAHGCLPSETRIRCESNRSVSCPPLSRDVLSLNVTEKEPIERAFGESLEWERLDQKGACRIKKDITLGGYRDQERWPVIQDAMIEAMIRLDKALAPHIARLKTRTTLN
jgi:hypothetical protein